MRGLHAMLWAALLPQFSMIEVGRMIGTDEIKAASDAVSHCLRLCLPPPSPRKTKEQQEIDWWELWTIGRVDLRLSDAEFWALTPRQFFFLSDRAYHNALLAQANVCRTLAELKRDSKKRADPYRLDEFLPQVRSKIMDPVQAKLAEVKRLKAAADVAFGMLGARRRPRG